MWKEVTEIIIRVCACVLALAITVALASCIINVAIDMDKQVEEAPKEYYPLTTVIVNIDRDIDVVTVRDCVGFEWQFEGAEDLEVGDICSMIMEKNGTPEVFDDIIVDYKYDGCAYMFE